MTRIDGSLIQSAYELQVQVSIAAIQLRYPIEDYGAFYFSGDYSSNDFSLIDPLSFFLGYPTTHVRMVVVWHMLFFS